MKKKSAKKGTAKGCKCLGLCQKKLQEQRPNVEFTQETFMNFKTGACRDSGPLLRVNWIDPKKKPRGYGLPAITCAYCPFCGKKTE